MGPAAHTPLLLETVRAAPGAVLGTQGQRHLPKLGLRKR